MGADPMAVSAGEVLAALSLATDLGTDQPLEHGLRTCVLCARLAAAAGCDEEERGDAYYLGLLHSVGCTSEAHEASLAFGDDLRLRSDFGEIDTGRPQELMAFLWRRTAESRAPHVTSFAAAVAGGSRAASARLRAHCEVGQRFATRLDLPAGVRSALWHVFERWDGKGMPRGIGGRGIPRVARVLHVARDADVHGALRRRGRRALDGRARSGRPTTRAGAARARDPARGARRARRAPRLGGRRSERSRRRTLAGDALDDACARHGRVRRPQVAVHARPLAGRRGAGRGGGVAAGPGRGRGRARSGAPRSSTTSGASRSRPDLGEARPARRPASGSSVRLHPYFTERVLARCDGLGQVVAIAARHHERLDGSGYHRGSRAARPAASLRGSSPPPTPARRWASRGRTGRAHTPDADRARARQRRRGRPSRRAMPSTRCCAPPACAPAAHRGATPPA